MFKRISLLAVMALSVIAVAAPAAQAEWLHSGAPLEENAPLSLHGTAKFVAPGGVGSFECTVTASVTAEPGGTGTVTSFAPATSTCVAAGALTGCKLKSHSASTPWVIDANTSGRDAIITDVTIFNQYEGCVFGITSTHLEIPEVTAVPDDPDAIHHFTISGEATNGTLISGTLTVTPAGTYGIAGL